MLFPRKGPMVVESAINPRWLGNPHSTSKEAEAVTVMGPKVWTQTPQGLG